MKSCLINSYREHLHHKLIFKSDRHYEIVEQSLTSKRLIMEKTLALKVEGQFPNCYTNISHQGSQFD